ncbi:Hpt domain-containing protein [Marinobacter sp. NP-4(2019)]|uniref:Hpt domain-containing protein n=1 Tax=Marinobacter sp. NP-4(2019) TaxID=2488665 RepID=UPI000FC3D59D|nr:Hpt domain-containing protein [Marinobacter sp. NP-4(2019)]AZT84427.1 Hpt domain-containing protein [Marinobacter sp. NP-4(2019)]
MNDKPHLDEEALAELKDVMEDEFEVLIHTYIGDSVDRLASIRDALEEGNADALVKAAHSFKGSSINIGAPRLGVLCLEVENAGREGRLAEAGSFVEEIDSEFRHVRSMLERILES